MAIFRDRRFWIALIIIGVVLLALIDRNNVMERRRLRTSIRELEVQRDYYMTKINDDSTLLEKLKDNDFLERYAREHYLFRRAGDELFVIRAPKAAIAPDTVQSK